MSETGEEEASTPAAKAADQMLTLLTEALPDGERRPGQHRMAHAIANAVDQGRNVVVQAGTGTGKSLAYLAGTLALDQTVVVATATKALQDQLDDSELPFVAEHVDGELAYAVLKGRSNYLCLQRLDEAASPGGQIGLAGMESGPSVNSSDLDEMKRWAKRTTTGDRAELSIEPRPQTWAAVSVGPLECPGAARCPRGDDCFAEKARKRADSADVIVVNTHLYGLHLAASRGVLPAHDVVVFDEAHELPDIITATNGISLSAFRMTNAARAVGSLVADEALIEGIRAAGKTLSRALDPHRGDRLKSPDPDITDALNLCAERLTKAAGAVRNIGDSSADVATRKARVANIITAVSVDLMLVTNPPSHVVTWIEDGRDEPTLEQAPLDVGETMDRLLWDPPDTGLDIAAGERDQYDEAPDAPSTVVLTSATIPDGLADRLHLDPEQTTVLDAGTPFDFEEQALLYCPAEMPDPRAADYPDRLVDELEELITIAGGRTLALFTSYRMMNLAADALSDQLDVTVLRQGDRPKPALMREFVDDETSCLFATMSFWQGIDVPGPALSMVTLDRIPFPRPDEPLSQARREAAGPNAFRLIDLPRAATLLAQGAGRLIRTATDRGVVAVLDSRLATNRSYRWDLINALPPMTRTKSRDDVAAFFDQ
jgi:ATP-dependent DNA helicase DinG